MKLQLDGSVEVALRVRIKAPVTAWSSSIVASGWLSSPNSVAAAGGSRRVVDDAKIEWATPCDLPVGSACSAVRGRVALQTGSLLQPHHVGLRQGFRVEV